MVTGLTNKDFPTFVALTFDRMYILENYIEALQGPSIQLVALDELVPDGTTRPLAVLLELMLRPWELPGLMRLGRDSSTALAGLRRVAALGF